jgi:DNA (cytosine-5)-methyltransferase 1
MVTPVTTASHKEEIRSALDAALNATTTDSQSQLPEDVKTLIWNFSEQVDKQATSAFTNIITCLASSVAEPACDPRYHRPPSGEMPAPSTGKTYFTGRTISEHVIYPWLAENGLRGAMSGWQTRVFERERPYTLDYRENINRVKNEFLGILDAVANGRVSAQAVLTEFLRLEAVQRDKRRLTQAALSRATVSEDITIAAVVDALEEHFSAPLSSRLPVLAMYAIYQAILPEVARYSGRKLAPLAEHSAADQHTDAVADVEVVEDNGAVFEAVEVKHLIRIDDQIVRRACNKARRTGVSRYYVLSTAPSLAISGTSHGLIKTLRDDHGCQMVLNGVIPTIKYYLRLIGAPPQFLEYYKHLLVSDRRVTQAQKEKWQEILKRIS